MFYFDSKLYRATVLSGSVTLLGNLQSIPFYERYHVCQEVNSQAMLISRIRRNSCQYLGVFHIHDEKCKYCILIFLIKVLTKSKCPWNTKLYFETFELKILLKRLPNNDFGSLKELSSQFLQSATRI